MRMFFAICLQLNPIDPGIGFLLGLWPRKVLLPRTLHVTLQLHPPANHLCRNVLSQYISENALYPSDNMDKCDIKSLLIFLIFNRFPLLIQEMANSYDDISTPTIFLLIIFISVWYASATTSTTMEDQIQALQEQMVCVKNTLDNMGISNKPRGEITIEAV